MAAVTGSEKMRGGLPLTNSLVRYDFLQILFRDSFGPVPPQNTPRFYASGKDLTVCEAKYIQIYGGVYRNLYGEDCFFR